MNQPASRLSIASDVRRLIKQVETGNTFDIDLTGHAFDVQEDATAALRARIGTGGLEDDVRTRIEHFARQSASTNLCCRLVVTDEMPDLPEYDPSSVSVYDGIQDAGSDFSQVIQRATIYGTLMTSVNITDLRAYFESGRKRRLLLFLGTDRDADMKALDKMLGALPAILAAAGLDAGAIREIIAAIKAGTLPAAAMKAISGIVAIAQLKSMPMTPQIARAIAALQKQLPALLARLQTTPGLAPSLLKIVTALVTASVTPVSSARTSMSLRAGNDNSQGKGAVQRLVQSIRPLSRDKTLAAETRTELAAILRGLRADMRADMRTMNAAPRLPALVSRLGTALAPLVLAATPVASVFRAMPLIAGATLSVMTTQAVARSISTLRAAPQTADLPPRTQTMLARMNDAPNPPAIARMVARNPQIVTSMPALATAQMLAAIRPADVILPGPAQQPVIAPAEKIAAPDKIVVTEKPPVEKPATENAPAKDPLPPQLNADGTRKPCCPEFNAATNPDGKLTRTNVENIFGRDISAGITVEEAQKYLTNLRAANDTITKTGLLARDTGDRTLQDDTARLIAKLEAQKAETGPHACGAFCNHAKGVPPPPPQDDRVAAAAQKIQSLSTRNIPPKTTGPRSFEP